MTLSSHFRLIKEISVGETPIVEYISIYSGVRVLIVSVERPLVDGIFVIPTEVGHHHHVDHVKCSSFFSIFPFYVFRLMMMMDVLML